MSELARCPCGKTPTALGYNLTQGTKWMDVTPNCCGEWTIETRTNYQFDHKVLMALAAEAWNDAPRAEELKS